MKKQPKALLILILVLSALISCQKTIDDFGTNGDPAQARTVENISGLYALTGLTWSYQGATINVYDSLDACEKDDLYKFSKDMNLYSIDAGVPCSPPGDETESWLLRNDSIFIGTAKDGARIKSFDGTTLVLDGAPTNEPLVKAVTTFTKQ
ncbi:MAG: lipocalin family protein [Chitinophagaceae bacterium]